MMTDCWNSYPEGGTGDLIGVYESVEAAEEAFRKECYDWHCIVDLQKVIDAGVIPSL